MKKFIPLIICIILIITSCVTLITKEKEVNYPPELEQLIQPSHMVFYQGDFWILGIPETTDILGKVIIKKKIEIDEEEYEYYEIYGDSVFEKPVLLKDAIKEEILYQKKNEIKTDTNTGLVLLSYLTGNAKTINEIKEHKIIESAHYFLTDEYQPKQRYKGSEHFYVSKIYFGTLSYYGVSQLEIQASLTGGIGSISENATTVSSLSELKRGIIALRLYPIKNLWDKRQTSNDYQDLIEAGYKNIE
jgi:hypothetical protein